MCSIANQVLEVDGVEFIIVIPDWTFISCITCTRVVLVTMVLLM